jgi:lipoyl-dependent peroxiredoxin subunit D
MRLENIIEELPDFAVDIKLNAKSLLNSAILNEKQKMIIFTACSFASKNKTLLNATLETAKDVLDESELTAAKIAGTLMSMTNVYYRFTHLVSNSEYSKMPAGLRMNGMAPAKHGINQVDFELASTAVSALNGCGMCMDSHEQNLKKHNVESNIIQEAVKIASTINSLSVILD